MPVATPPELSAEDAGLIVKPEVARRQLDAEVPQPGTTESESTTTGAPQTGNTTAAPGAEPAAPRLARRFHSTMSLDPARIGRYAGRIAEEVIARTSQASRGAEVSVTLEIEARLPNGASEQTFRAVTKNS
jgi:hypothetical protein